MSESGGSAGAVAPAPGKRAARHPEPPRPPRRAFRTERLPSRGAPGTRVEPPDGVLKLGLAEPNRIRRDPPCPRGIPGGQGAFDQSAPHHRTIGKPLHPIREHGQGLPAATLSPESLAILFEDL